MSKRRIKISPTLLNTFLQCRRGDWKMDSETLRERITGEFEMNEAVSRGWAYHQMIEHGPELFEKDSFYEVYEPRLDKTWLFAHKAVEPIFHVRNKHQQMIHEAKVSLVVEFTDFDVVMNMKIDGLDLRTIYEFKTTGRKKGFMDFYDSIQHKCYLAALPETTAVVYKVFQLGRKNDWCRMSSFVLLREGNEMQVVKSALSDMLDWLRMNPELLDYMKSKVTW
jgi:hypothetical protein